MTKANSKISPITAAPSNWFYGSGFDLVVGCAAWSAPLLFVAYLLSSNYPDASSIAFYGLALVFNYPHYMATVYRAYRTPGDFTKYRVFTFHLTLLVGLLLILSHVSYQLLALAFTVYLTWSPFHYSGQNFGIALMFARRNGVKTTPQSRRMFYMAFLASYLMFFLTVHSSPSGDQFILTLGIPLKVARILWVGAFTGFMVAVLSSLSVFVKQTNWRAMTAPVVLLSTQVFWFVVPTALTLFTNVDVVHERSTAGILAIMHSAQYLWITSYYARREALSEKAETNPNRWRPVIYFVILVVGGIALFVPGPWFVSRVLRQDFTTSFLAFTALINIHHFLLDGAIWKLRDGRIASLLLNTRREDVSEVTGSAFRGLFGWLTSPNQSARMIKVGAALVLVLLAGLDQAKFYYGAQASDASSLQRAQSLNPYDSALQLKLARASDRAGNSRANRAALEAAVGINPNYRPAQVAYAKALIETREFEKAYAHYKQMLGRFEPDVDSLVNFGLLASQLGHEDEAIESWRKAVTLDESQAAAQLYLAEALTRKRQFADAIPHYQNYLALMASQTATLENTVVAQPPVVINAILKLAAAYQNRNDNQQAIRFFMQAATLAESIGDRRALVFALVHAAEVKAKIGQRLEALEDFRKALMLENSVSELAAATDWVAYARFLRQNKASSRMVLSCFVKAEKLLQNNHPLDTELPNLKQTIERELKLAETNAGDELESIKLNLNEAVEQVLAFKL